MDIQTICYDVVRETDGALGCLLIDLNTGLVIASAHRPGMVPDEAGLATVLRSGSGMFRGALIEQFVQALSTDGRASARSFVREVQLSTQHSFQFMGALPNWDDGMILLVTERTISLGIGWMAIHRAQQQFEDSRPSGLETALKRALRGDPEPSKPVFPRARMKSEQTPGRSGTAPAREPAAPGVEPITATDPAAGRGPGESPAESLVAVPGDRSGGAGAADPRAQPEASQPMGPRGRMFRPRRPKS